MPIVEGSIVEGTVTGITRFGAFVNLPENAVGMVHISEISDIYVTDINQHLKVGDVIKVKVLRINQSGKYDLSIKQINSPVSAKKRPLEEKKSLDPFEDKITKFLKQSEEKLLDFKKNLQYKQEGRPRKKKIK